MPYFLSLVGKYIPQITEVWSITGIVGISYTRWICRQSHITAILPIEQAVLNNAMNYLD